MAQCEYRYWYNNTKTREHDDYFCDRDSILNSGYCKFHHPIYYQEHPEDVIKSFLEELKLSQDTKFFIGCNIPNIVIKEIGQINSIYFIKTKFHGDVKFINTIFESVNFSSSEIYGKCEFSDVTIKDTMLFINVKLHNKDSLKTRFQRCNFKIAKFSITKFNKIEFINCNFNHLDFIFTKFTNLIIKKCDFKGPVDFRKAVIKDGGEFNTTMFHNVGRFQYSDFKGIIKFNEVDFKEQELIRFGKNMSNTSFVGTDITRVQFDPKTKWGQKDPYEIHDERELKNSSAGSLSSVLATYRNLRENYEFRLMYGEAGQFFIKEMDLKRKYYEDPKEDYKTKPRKIRRFLSMISCYNILCQYGEGLGRAVCWLLSIFVVATVYFFIYPDINGLETTKSLDCTDYSRDISNNISDRIKTSIERTLASFFQIDKNNMADYLVRITSLPVLGILFVVLRRRFERKFRH